MRTLTHARVEYLRNIEDVNELTVQDAVDLYLDDYFHRHKITSYTAACQILERELLSKLDRNQKITTITQKQVDDLRDNLHARNLYDENKIIGMIKRVFKNINDIYGWNCKPISRMYLTHVSYSDLKNKDVITYNIEQFKRFISCCDTVKERLIAKLLFFIGLRLGELRALKWSDINFDKRQIHIFRSATSKIGEGCTLIDPKTKTSIRTLRLPDSVFLDLVEYKNMNPSTEFIFESKVKTHLCLISETAIIKILKKVATKADLPYLHPHAWRHSCASYLVQELKCTPIEVQKWLGHSSVVTTTKIYVHLFEEDFVRVAQRIDDTFNKQKK